MPDPEETQPTTPEQPALSLDDGLDVEELLSFGGTAQPAATAPSPDADAEDEPDEDEEEDDAEAEDGATEDGEDAGEPDEAQPPTDPLTPEAIQAAGAMLAEAPQRINELPRKQRAAAIEEAMRLSYIKGVGDMFARQSQQSTQEQELRTFYDERVAARDANPDEFLNWEDENPEDAARFAQARAYFKAKAEGKAPTLPGQTAPVAAAGDGKPKLTESQQTIQDLANREGPRLSALPQAARDAIAERGFALTVDGLEAFRAAISEAEAAARRGTDAPARRQEAHRARLATARPDVGTRGNAAPPKKNPIADINDVDTLMDMALVGAGGTRRG